MHYSKDDRLVSSQYGSPRMRLRSPYERRPERDTWTETEVREAPTGERYTATREVSRWGAEHTYGAWTVQG